MAAVRQFPLEPHLTPATVKQNRAFKEHCFRLMYSAVLGATKNSLKVLKKRVCSRGGTGFLYLERPFFEVDVQLSVPSTVLSPSLDDIQSSINKAALAVLQCSKKIWLWDQHNNDGKSLKRSYFEKISSDLAIVQVVLLLTGGIQGTRNQVTECLTGFKKYDWLWKDDKEHVYRHFVSKEPDIADFEREMKRVRTR